MTYERTVDKLMDIILDLDIDEVYEDEYDYSSIHVLLNGYKITITYHNFEEVGVCWIKEVDENIEELGINDCTIAYYYNDDMQLSKTKLAILKQLNK